MHETFMAQQIATELDRLARPYQPCRLTRVTLKVGLMRQVVSQLLCLALEVATRQTAAEGAEFAIEQAPPRCRCQRCDTEFAVREWDFSCPACRSGQVTGLTGDELIIETVTIEKEDGGTERQPG